MATKREVIAELNRGELLQAVGQLGVEVRDRRVRDQLVDALAGKRGLDLGALLGDLPRERLKEMCRALGLDDGGREKSLLVARLTGTSAPDAGTSSAKSKAEPATDLSPEGRARGEKFPGLSDEQVIRIVQDHAPALARGYARHQATVMGLPPTTVDEVDPMALPSMFRLASFIYARKNRQRYQSAGFNKGELYDQLHFTDAAYADLIVSADQRFHDTVAVTGIPTTIVKRSDATWTALLEA